MSGGGWLLLLPEADVVADKGVCYPSLMIRNHSLPPFSLLALFKRSPSQVVRPDATFYSVGRALGPPSRWDFSGDSVTFDSLFDYHDNLQIELWIREEQVEVRRVGIRMWTASEGRPVPKLGKMKYASRRVIKFDGFEPGISVDEAKNLLEKASIFYTEEAVANALETVVLLRLSNKTHLDFFMMGGRPSLASIQAYSEYEGT